MPSSMCKSQTAKPLAIDSARYPRTTRPGNRSATPLPAGASAARGMCCWRCCASRCTPRQAGELSLSMTIIDSQSVKTISKRGRRRQMNQRAQAPHSRRHNGIAAGFLWVAATREQSDQLGAEHVRLEHAGDQAPSAAWF